MERLYRVTTIIEEFNPDFSFLTIHKTINLADSIGRLKHYIISGKVWAENFMEKELVEDV